MKIIKSKVFYITAILLLLLITGVGASHIVLKDSNEPVKVAELPPQETEVSEYDLNDLVEADTNSTNPNPSYQIQTYFNFPRIVTKELNSQNSVNPSEALQNYPNAPDPDTTPYFINTAKQEGDVEANLPTNATRAKINYLTGAIVNEEDEDGENQEHLETAYYLEQLFADEDTTYYENPQIQYMSRLYDGNDKYNSNYTLAQVWVFQPSLFGLSDSDITDDFEPSLNQWIVYNVPESSGETTIHDPSQIRFTNNPANPYITINNASELLTKAPQGTNAFLDGITIGDTLATNQIQYIVKESAGNDPNSSYPYTYTILIQENTIVRLIYEITEDTNTNESADFYDYDISNGGYYINYAGRTALANGSSMWYPQNNIIIHYDDSGKATAEEDPYNQPGEVPQYGNQQVSANMYHWGINNYNLDRKMDSDSAIPTGTDKEDFGAQPAFGLSFGNQYFGIDYSLISKTIDEKYYPNFYQEMNFTNATTNNTAQIPTKIGENDQPTYEVTPNYQNGVGVGVFGLVTGIEKENGITVPVWNTKLGEVPSLFGSKNDLAVPNTYSFGFNKTVYSKNPDLATEGIPYEDNMEETVGGSQGVYYMLNFYRQGGTYTLNAVNPYSSVDDSELQIGPKYGGVDNLRALNSWNSSNEFWPLDNEISWGTTGHDPKYGGAQNYPFNTTYIANTNNGSTAAINYIAGGDFTPDFGYQIPANNSKEQGDGKAHNGAFAMSYEIDFKLEPGYSAPLEYWFYGDDDMWVILSEVTENDEIDPTSLGENGTVIADIGGIHAAMGSYTNLWDYIEPIPYTDDDGNAITESKNYKLNIFYTERGAGGGSCCYMRYTLPLEPNAQENNQNNQLIINKELFNVEGEEVLYNTQWQYSSENSWEAADSSYADNLFSFNLSLATTNGSDFQDLYPYQIFAAGDDISTDKPIASGSIGDYKSGPGEYYFTLFPGTFIVISNLPSDCQYNVEEIVDAAEYEVKTQYGMIGDNTLSGLANTYTVENELEESNYVNFVNYELEEPVMGTLSVKKQTNNTTTQAFTFNLTLENEDEDINSITGIVSPGNSSQTIQLGTNDYFTFHLLSGQTITFNDLPLNTDYSIEEVELEYYTIDWGKVQPKGTIDEDNPIVSLEANNIYSEPGTGSLIVRKNVVGSDTTEFFNFTIKFLQDGTPMNGNISFVTNNSLEPDSLPLDNGLATFNLAGGDSITFINLPYGVEYSITEVASTEYSTSWDNQNGTIDSTNPSITATVTNTFNLQPQTGTLTVTKKALEAQSNEVFNFVASFSNTSGNLTGNIQYTYSDSGKEYSEPLTNGAVNFTLSPNQSITFMNLPYETTYKLEEVNLTGYTVSWTNSSGKISATNMNPVSVATNTKVVPGEAQISIQKLQSIGDSVPTRNTMSFKAGDIVTYYLNITNSGMSAANNVVVSDVIPTGLTYVSGSATNGGMYNELTNTFSWNLNQIVAGQTVTVSFRAQIPSNITSNTTYRNIGYAAYNGVQYSSNEVKLENTPASNNSSSNTTTNTTSTINKVSPKTGNDNIGLIALVVVIAICAVVIYANYRKNQKKGKDY